MCGIAGFVVDAGSSDLGELTAMCDRLAHRGPDDAGARVWADHGVGLGHRRLSIIDLSPSGRNPMANEDETVWVVHNGEIYNYRKLRRELERRGHAFRSESDTEVLVHGYEEWGDDHVHRLQGMFAYAIYDRRRPSPRMLLVRDRLGIKPLHYSWDGSRLAFGSELKALLALPWVSRTPDRAALADYLTYLYVPAPKSAFAAIRKLRPAERLVLEDGHVETETYWDVDPVPGDAGGDAEGILREQLERAVERHMVADVPVGLFLSGGLDSSAVASLMRGREGPPVRAYSIGFDVPEHTETSYASAVAERLGLQHRVRTVAAPEARDALDRMTDLYDEPFADASSIPTLHLSLLGREEVKVALGGDGGDEVFGGYWWYEAWRRGERLGVLPKGVRRATSGGVALLPRLRDVTWLTDLGAEPIERYAALVELFSPVAKRSLLSGQAAAQLDGYDDRWHLREHWRPELDPQTRMQYVDLKTYLPGDILTKVDRASMSASLEVRPPLLDHQLVESVFHLPASTRGTDKALLRRAMAGRLPAEVLSRPKKGFSVPWSRWAAELRTSAAGELRDGALVGSGFLAPDPMARLETARLGPRMWALLVLERWARRYL
jgi:asparagine synthase (glutamine-hydrolysing)